MAKQLCKSHITKLSQVATKLAYNQKMDSTQLILGEDNKVKVKKAEELIYRAINILKDVQ